MKAKQLILAIGVWYFLVAPTLFSSLEKWGRNS